MNIETGQIMTEAEAMLMNAKHSGLCIPMNIPPTLEQQRQGKIGRNDPCPCGSGKKFKRCCLLSPK